MNTPPLPSAYPSAPQQPKPGGWKKKLLVVCGVLLACCGIAAAATAWWVKRNVYAAPFQTAMLTPAEQSAFDQKVEQIKATAPMEAAPADGKTPEQRAEEAKRTITITEKEINAYLEQIEPGLSKQVLVKLGDDTLGAELLIPFDPSMPLLGGKTVRLNVKLDLGMTEERKFSLAVSDVSVGGVPMPNAWLGDIKGVNMLASATDADPVVQRFLAGIREFEIKAGALRVLLNE